MRRRLLGAALALLAAGCARGAAQPPIQLDGSLHPASDAGVVTIGRRDAIVLDGTRRYGVSPALVVFIPGTLRVAPLADTVGRYALVGTRGHQVVWLETLPVVAQVPGGPPTVFFFGTMTGLREGTVTFGDGTVLPAVAGITVPRGISLPAPVRADIDPSTHKVRALAPA